MAKRQLEVIALYLEDFKQIIDTCGTKDKKPMPGGFTETTR